MMTSISIEQWTVNSRLRAWIEEIKTLCQPDKIYLCDGSQQEYDRLTQEMVASGTMLPLDPQLRPDSFLCRSTVDDVARVEENTYICSEKSEEAGPTNNWYEPVVMRCKLKGLFQGCMRGRTLYIIPFSMGPLDSPLAQIGVQLTDSPYVVCSMRIMTRMGTAILKQLGDGFFVPCLHSVGAPLDEGQQDVTWPCNPKHQYIVHFPESREIWSYGSGYGGNALLGKKCLALRIASVMGRDEGWLAEHMLIMSVTDPAGEKKYFAAAFPSACGKTNLAMLMPSLPGWKVETVGDDIAWMKFDTNGYLRAINPEAGFFGVAPGTSMSSNPNAMQTMQRCSIFTNVALTAQGDIWWEGMTPKAPEGIVDWRGQLWQPHGSHLAAQPNARFTAPAAQCPVIDSCWEDPQGVPISAILFGGRRSTVIPLVREALSWQQGVFFGASISSETTAAAAGTIGKLRHDPFAMLPFCGYNMGDYFTHWLNIGKVDKNKGTQKQLPKIFYVNWFRKGADGSYLWPGFGENSRVLKWIFERCKGVVAAEKTPIGYLPKADSLDIANLNITSAEIKQLLAFDKVGWRGEIDALEKYFARFGTHLPLAIHSELNQLQDYLSASSS